MHEAPAKAKRNKTDDGQSYSYVARCFAGATKIYIFEIRRKVIYKISG